MVSTFYYIAHEQKGKNALNYLESIFVLQCSRKSEEKTMENKKGIPITLITGYLGSGKTTLINHILRNTNNHKMAVIVNDIGEVNIDADLIANEGVVSGKDENLVALSNGCICCTLKQDLIDQLDELVATGKFDHILIEASGICEPVPIAQTITYMEDEFVRQGKPKAYYLDAIVSVTDALRLRDEFRCGEILITVERGEENIENLIIQQLEFTNVVLLNKVSLISETELNRVKKAVNAIQPEAEIIECDFCKVNIDDILDTELFDFEAASTSAAWIREFDDWETDVEVHDDDEDEDEEHDHNHEHDEEHHHHHHHKGTDNEEGGTALEYNINTFVYYRRRPFNLQKLKNWIENESGKHHIIRAKGICYFDDEKDSIYVFESAGLQNTLTFSRKWLSATLNKKQLQYLLETDENFAHDWDDKYKDHLIKLVFIGQNISERAIRKELDLV